MQVSRWSAAVTVLALAGLAPAEGRARVQVTGNVLVAQALEEAGDAQATITGPSGFVLQRSFAAGEAVAVSLVGPGGALLPDGQYFYEVSWSPRTQLERGKGDTSGTETLARGLRASGTFRVTGGQAALPADIPEREGARAGGRAPDTTFNDAICVGVDCPASPNFSDTTILLMENNTRIKYDDTSSTAGFAANDWQLAANDQPNGGANRFFIQDCGLSTQGGCSGNIPFSLSAGAPSNAVFVDSSGRVGFRTATPVLDLHVNTSNTPALRVEQNGSGGFTAQTWDVAGNEANFFVRDVTSGSRMPLRIRPGAPTSSLDILGGGNVGVGTASAGSSLHVFRSDGTAKLKVEEASGTLQSRNLLQIVNNGASTFRFDNTNTGAVWGFGSRQAGGDFFIGNTPGQVFAMLLTPAGNMTITGTYSSSSDRNAKEGIEAVDPAEVLDKLAGLPIASWRYKGDEATHVGPMAQDFYAAFGLGQDDKHIAPTDMAGLALAAIQALRADVAEKDARLEAQAAEIRALNERLARLERR